MAKLFLAQRPKLFHYFSFKVIIIFSLIKMVAYDKKVSFWVGCEIFEK